MSTSWTSFCVWKAHDEWSWKLENVEKIIIIIIFLCGQSLWTCLFFEHLKSVFSHYTIFILWQYCKMVPHPLEEVVSNFRCFVFRLLRDSSYGGNENCWVQTGPIFIPPPPHLASLVKEEVARFQPSSSRRDYLLSRVETNSMVSN